MSEKTGKQRKRVQIVTDEDDDLNDVDEIHRLSKIQSKDKFIEKSRCDE